MTSEFDIDAVTRNAVSLGIILTEADEGTDHYEQWAACVMQAQLHFDQSEHQLCQVMIDEANRVAIPPREAAPGVKKPKKPKRPATKPDDDYLTDAEYAELQGEIDATESLKPSRPKKHCERYDPDDDIPF
jgi:hypothetical protein